MFCTRLAVPNQLFSLILELTISITGVLFTELAEYLTYSRMQWKKNALVTQKVLLLLVPALIKTGTVRNKVALMLFINEKESCQCTITYMVFSFIT